MSRFIFRAMEFAARAHHGQLRKYTGEPYIVHPVGVAAIVSTVTCDEEILAAALLHDTVEDVEDVTLDIVANEFGARVGSFVDDLTDISKPEDGNRKTRKRIDLRHTAYASPEAKTVKLADLIHNSISIVEHDKNFAVVYMKEKQRLLEVLTEGNPTLLAKANQLVKDYYLRKLDERHR